MSTLDLIGFRLWRVTWKDAPDPDHPEAYYSPRIHLMSLCYDFDWHLDGPSIAECVRCQVIPNPEHECGLYAWPSFQQCQSYATAQNSYYTRWPSVLTPKHRLPDMVMGITRLGGLAMIDYLRGEVVGARTQQAIPAAFISPTPQPGAVLEDIAEHCRVPILYASNGAEQNRIARLASEWGDPISKAYGTH